MAVPKPLFEDVVITELERLSHGRELSFWQVGKAAGLCELIATARVENPASVIDRLDSMLDSTEDFGVRRSLRMAISKLQQSVSSAVCGND